MPYICFMNMTPKQKRIHDRRLNVRAKYDENFNEDGTTKIPIGNLVKQLATKHKATEVTIYNDIRATKPASV